MDSIGLPPDTLTLAARLALATLLGATVGLNREISLKPAGLRPHALVAPCAALLSYIGLQLGRPAGDGAAASRLIQGMGGGIGFIGVRVILHRVDIRMVGGLTTAASILV